nr:OsmC family protein [Oceanococcus sp. HetDA_MAG_MS8]
MKTIAQARTVAGSENYRQDIQTKHFTLVADEPESAGGQNAGPAPYDYLLASLGACTAMTLQMYAERKNWVLQGLRVDLELLKSPDGETHIQRVLHCDSPLESAQWDKLIDIAGKTPVTKTLLTGAQINTRRGSPD